VVISASHLWAFAAVAAVLIAVPGPSVLFTISRALIVGRRRALFSVLGNACGTYTQVVAVSVGVGSLVERSVAVFTVLKWVGAGYLIYLGVQAIRHRRAITEALETRPPPRAPLPAMRDGVLVGATNPKTIVFLAVALPEFTNPAAGHLPEQMLIIGALFPLIALALDSLWALAAGTARQWLARSPRGLELVGGAGGLSMIGIGASLAVTGRKD
jgi:threonine/homoserine/homoserine lactone efflux protein